MITGKTALFGVVIAVAAGLFGANVVQIHNDSQNVLSNSLTAGSPILGHVEVVKRDSQGNIVAYRQGDNLIVNQGLNCMGAALFRTVILAASTATAQNCGGAGGQGSVIASAFNTVSGFRWIDIGSGTEAVASVITTMTNLGGAFVTASTPFQSGGVILTPIYTTGTATGAGAAVSISATGFTVSGPVTVSEAGLFDNSAGTVNMFARQTFAAITMSTGDTLAVTWTITLAHG